MIMVAQGCSQDFKKGQGQVHIMDHING